MEELLQLPAKRKPEPFTGGEGTGTLLWGVARATRAAVRRLYNVDNERNAAWNRWMRIRRSRLRFDLTRFRGVKTACCGARHVHSSVKWGYSKISNINRCLERNFDHDRVLFVQHPLEKAWSRGVQSGSFVACAEVLGNCDRATEGGIPRSSR